jgi:hypothetical protein
VLIGRWGNKLEQDRSGFSAWLTFAVIFGVIGRAEFGFRTSGGKRSYRFAISLAELRTTSKMIVMTTAWETEGKTDMKDSEDGSIITPRRMASDTKNATLTKDANRVRARLLPSIRLHCLPQDPHTFSVFVITELQSVQRDIVNSTIAVNSNLHH